MVTVVAVAHSSLRIVLLTISTLAGEVSGQALSRLARGDVFAAAVCV